MGQGDGEGSESFETGGDSGGEGPESFGEIDAGSAAPTKADQDAADEERRLKNEQSATEKAELDGKKSGGKPKKPKKLDKKPGAEAKDEGDGQAAAGDDEAGKGDDAEKPAQSRKVKIKVGDELQTIDGSATVRITVDGKKEDATIAEAIDALSGERNIERRTQKITEREKAIDSRQNEMMTLVKDLAAKSEESPEAAFDLLANLTGQDAVALKEKQTRETVEVGLSLLEELGYEIPREEISTALERKLHELKIGWREQRVSQKEKREQENAAQAEKSSKVQAAMDQYGVSSEEWAEAERAANEYFKSQGQEDNASDKQVLEAWSHMKTADLIRQHVSDEDFADHPEASEAYQYVHLRFTRNPKEYGPEQVERDLKRFDIIGAESDQDEEEEDPASLERRQRLAGKVQRNQATRGGKTKPGKESDAELWDEI